MALRIGVISDTHGLLRPEAKAFLAGSDHIVHGGDIGNQAILDELAAIAPLTVVRGNNDRGVWAEDVPETALLTVGGVRIYAIHDISQLDIDPVAEDVAMVVYGHSHKPVVEHRGEVIYLNPGSAGPRRFSLPISAAEIVIEDSVVNARVVDLIER